MANNMSVLAQICADKMDHVNRTERLIPSIVLEEKAKLQSAPRGFINKLKDVGAQGPALIAEVKKASPSKGIIRSDFDPVKIARAYQNAGAACISVLTDQPYFKGHDEDLEAVREVVHLPVLRKDFMLTQYQIIESRALGADCVLIIMAALEDAHAKDLYDYATSLGMDVLVEVHDKEELDRALMLNPRMIGVNSRNLKTLEVSLATAEALLQSIPPSIVRVAESGIRSNEALKHLQSLGYNAFLVGESLMREDDIEAATKNLLGK